MKKEAPSPVIVCRLRGHEDRFFAKYKDTDETNPKRRWKKIPGGPFPPEVDTIEKALACARRWYELEMADRHLAKRPEQPGAMTWPAACDAFVGEVKARVRGADASRDEAEKRAKFLRHSAILSTRPVKEHDDALALAWLRSMLSEPIVRKGRESEPRDPLTVRNVAKVLRDIYKFARLQGYFPRDRQLPTESDEFKAEIAGALKEKAKLGKVGRVACPVETVRAVVRCEDVSWLRRTMTRTSFYTGVRPGEMHALRLGDYRREFGVQLLDVREQQTLDRKGYPAKL